MKKYTANYTYTNPNFVIQNLVENKQLLADKQLLYVLKNILQRGFPTILSQYLQGELGQIHHQKSFKEPFLFVSNQCPKWIKTIKGDDDNQYFPAKDFLEKIIPNDFGDFRFIQSLILPEVLINEITSEDNTSFRNQRVDFYLPQAKLVIEIDGQQHKLDDNTRLNDIQRNDYLKSKDVKTIRISTNELNNGTYKTKIKDITDYLSLEKNYRKLKFYKEAFEKLENNNISEEEVKSKLIPTAIIRFQILLIELLLNDYLNFTDDWKFNLILKENEQLDDFSVLAIRDFFVWYDNLYTLKEKKDFIPPDIQVNTTYSLDEYDSSEGVININFSLFERWTDSNEIHSEMIIVRTDYFGTEKNYFRVSSTTPINYNITEEDKPTLEFLLLNLFEKESFKNGQFPIISNVLNRNDTVGLLPTGGGKSLCYQLPCLLQPSVNFVVCPIKSLMYDQYANMKNAYITNTNFITGDQDAEEKKQVQSNFAAGHYLFIWISPERFQIKTFRSYIESITKKFTISYAVIDEVHCMSEWGHDFRTSYLNLTQTIERYCSTATLIGLTATASVNVLKDIKVEFSRNNRKLNDENIKSLLDYSREELVFNIIKDQNNKEQELKDIISQHDLLNQTNKATLIFTPHVNGRFGCYGVANSFTGSKVKWYSGEVPKVKNSQTGRKQPVMSYPDFFKYKKDIQTKFKNDHFPVLVATKSFGMGIDKQNIHHTIHYGIPSSVESLYQEAGRAGRWEDKKKKAICYVLYSEETTAASNVDRLFEMDTSFTEMKAINEEVKWDGKDIFRNIFLFTSGQKDVIDEYKVTTMLIKNYFKSGSKEIIYFNTVVKEIEALGITGFRESLIAIAQKGIYRLRILGIVKDWTTNFIDHYEVEFRVANEANIKNSLYDYISKYESGINLDEELSKQKQKQLSAKCIWFLLQWTFENIAYNRKQSLKTLADWCNEFEDIGNEAFKRRIDNYFKFTDTTFIFQHIAENPNDYKEWMEVFYIEKDLVKGQKGIYIPTIENIQKRKIEYERLRDSLSRFLETYRNNVGLNYISGLIRLSLGQYSNTDGKIRFEDALKNIKNNFDVTSQNIILEQAISYGYYLNETGKEGLCTSISKFYPERLEALADKYGLFYLLDDTVSLKVDRLQKLNQKLYGTIKQIGEV